MLLFQSAKLENHALKSKTCAREFVFFLEKCCFSDLFVGVKEENWFSYRFCRWRTRLLSNYYLVEKGYLCRLFGFCFYSKPIAVIVYFY